MRRESSIGAPAPVSIQLTRGEMMLISNESDRRNSFRNYASRSDAWGRGFISNPARVGLAGEYALCSYLNSQLKTELVIDSALRPKGDSGKDLDVFGTSIQIKTRISAKSNLVRRVNSWHAIQDMNADYFVFAAMTENIVSLLGFLPTSLVRELGAFAKSKVSDHFNLSIDDTLLDPMCRLVKELQLARVSWR